MVTRSSLIPLVVLLSAITVGATTGRAQQPDAEIENVRAFAKLYGYVRWFHPADEAALVDWDRFAIEGVRKVRPAETTAELRGALEALFRPIAPWVRVYPEGTSPKVPALVPPDTTGLVVVAWQHQGVGLSRGSQYQSVRLNRPPLLREPVGILYLQRSAADLRGRQIRLSAFAQLLPPGGEASALRLFLEDGEGRRHNSPNFHADTVVAVVAENADSVTLGAVLEGTGEGRLQRLRLEVQKEDGWHLMPLGDPGGSVHDVAGLSATWSVESRWSSWPTRMSTGKHRIGRIDAGAGGSSLFIAMDRKPVSEPLFPEHPSVGEVTEAPLARGPRAWVPLALYSDEHGTPGGTLRPRVHVGAPPRPDVDAEQWQADDPDVRMANILIAWNVFQHFYPYFDVVDGGESW